MVARRCHTRYSSRMTEFKPLGYAASVVVFLLIVAYAAAMQWSPGFRRVTTKALKRGAWYIVGVPLYLFGMLMRAGAAGAIPFAWMVYAIGDLWFRPLGIIAWGWVDSLLTYSGAGAYRPRHAA